MERAFLQISILRFNPGVSSVKLFFSDVYIKSSSQKLLFLFFCEKYSHLFCVRICCVLKGPIYIISYIAALLRVIILFNKGRI